jgi:hypothetical protein
MNTCEYSSKRDKFTAKLTQPMSDFMQIFWHITCLFWLQLINVYADNISARSDVRAILSGMILMGSFTLLCSLFRTISGHRRLSFVEFVFPVGVFMVSAFFLGSNGDVVIDAVMNDPKTAVLYGVGFVIGAAFMKFSGGYYSVSYSYDSRVECQGRSSISASIKKD